MFFPQKSFCFTVIGGGGLMHKNSQTSWSILELQFPKKMQDVNNKVPSTPSLGHLQHTSTVYSVSHSRHWC